MGEFFYKIKVGEKELSRKEDEPFDPASISKLFYACYAFDKINLNSEILLNKEDYLKYKYGTVGIKPEKIGKKFRIKELVELMICDSCNIATGLIADFVDRENVNKYIKSELGLYKTTIKSDNTPNVTTINDLVIFIDKMPSQLIDLMSKNRRVSSIASALKQKIPFKGGTTLNGDRRELAIIYPGGYIIVVQKSASNMRFFKKALFNWYVKKLVKSAMF